MNDENNAVDKIIRRMVKICGEILQRVLTLLAMLSLRTISPVMKQQIATMVSIICSIYCYSQS